MVSKSEAPGKDLHCSIQFDGMLLVPASSVGPFPSTPVRRTNWSPHVSPIARKGVYQPAGFCLLVSRTGFPVC